jgi:DNA-binding MarR family transcriptional regulator
MTTIPQGQGHGPDLGSGGALAEELLAVIGLLRRHLRRVAGRPWPLSSLTASQSELLRLVHRAPGTSVAEAAAELGLVANTVSTLVGRLTEQGLLRRVADPLDRRVARLTLTDLARREIDAWRDRRAARVTEVLDEMGPADLDALRTALPALTGLAERLRPEGEPRPAPPELEDDRWAGGRA